MFDELGQIAEVRHNRDFVSIAAKRESDRIRCVVRNRKRRDFDIADREAVSRMEIRDVREALVRRFGNTGHRGAMRGRRKENRGAPEAENLRQSADMIAVLVGDDDAIEAVDPRAERFQPAKSFAFAEAGVDEETGGFRFEQRNVARTAGRQNRNADTDRTPPKNN